MLFLQKLCVFFGSPVFSLKQSLPCFLILSLLCLLRFSVRGGSRPFKGPRSHAQLLPERSFILWSVLWRRIRGSVRFSEPVSGLCIGQCLDDALGLDVCHDALGPVGVCDPLRIVGRWFHLPVGSDLG